ncbi:MAG TPA: hypothetical protein VGO67_02165 [Verrucomicrobiae bacterium]|jgi:hypothetical protein
MESSPNSTENVDVPTQVFEAFLKSIQAAGEDAELVARLRKTLMEERSFSEAAMKMAIFGHNPSL